MAPDPAAGAPPPKPVGPGLYLVATPIGNLRDITLRALDVLAAADRVLAEDTRVAARLLGAFGLKRPLERYDEHVAERATPAILEALAAGQVIALVSDAGTPLISDPGYRLVGEVVAQGHKVHPIPGPSAVLAALTLSGLPTDRFLFAGFMPPKSAARRRALAELAAIPSTLVLFETGPRLRAALSDMAEVLGERPAAVIRELTKIHETCIRGPLSALAADPALDGPRGEIVVVIGPPLPQQASAEDGEAALAEALSRLSPAEAASEVARALGLNRRELYRRAIDLKDSA